MASTLKSLQPGISVTRYAGPVHAIPDKTRTRYQIDTDYRHIDIDTDQAIALIILLTKMVTGYRECDHCERTD